MAPARRQPSRPRRSTPRPIGVSDAFNRVQVDLADLVGSPGLPRPGELAERMSGAFGGAYAQRAEGDQPFLFGEIADRLLGSPQAKVSSFVGRLNDGLPDSQLLPDDMTVLVTKESATGTHLVVQQTLRGTEVVGARFQLHLGDDSRPYGLTGRPVGDLPSRDPGGPPRTSDIDAIDALRRHFGLPREIRIGVQRVVFPVPGQAVWAYEGRFVLYDPIADVRAYVRADDLSLLVSYNVASSALRGEANVFPVNPRRTPNLTTVRLDHIGPTPPDRLTGPVVEVRPRTGAAFTQAFRDCRLQPADPGFDEAHAFYHLGNAVRYFESILDRPILQAAPFAPVRAIVRDPQSAGNAFFVPSTGQLLFGDFGARPTARSADIIYHEFGHAVSDAICRLGRSPLLNTPGRGMSEGYSDYFQASAFEHPRIGDFVLNSARGLRDISKTGLRFGPGFEGEEHATGEIWGAVLWGIRSRLGAGVSDMIVVESLQFLNPNATFEEGLGALLQADARLFPTAGQGGRHEDVINDEFDQRRPQ
jgi:hypothetical protein